MAAPPSQIPSTFDVVDAFVDRLVEERPTAAPHVVEGRYGDLIVGQTGQFRLLRGRLVQEALAARLPFAEGQALTDLAASEYESQRTAGAVRAVGEVTVRRSVVHYRADAPYGGIPVTDRDSVGSMLTFIQLQMENHALNVYDAGTGLGSHVSPAPIPDHPLSSFFTMDDWVGHVNYHKQWLNDHFAGGEWHKDADTLSVITEGDAFASDGAASFDDNDQVAQQSVIKLAIAIVVAYDSHVALESKAGSIRRGTVWVLSPDPTAIPAVTGGQYESLLDVPINVGVQGATIPVRATRAGAFANIPAWAAGGPTLQVSTPVLFDAGATLPLATTALRAAGGSDGQSDPELRRTASAFARGNAGPTSLALDAGALATVGASRTVTRDDLDAGTAYVYPVDVAWSQSATWTAGVLGALADGWQGFGCRVKAGAVLNQIVRLELTVVLRDTAYLTDTAAITDSIHAALRAYFDDRPDWYIWRLTAIRAAVARAHRRILTCSSAAVRDGEGAPLAEPAQPTAGAAITHYTFADNAVDITFAGPT